ncbi:hypothetical protein [Methylorubrum aminovorans]
MGRGLPLRPAQLTDALLQNWALAALLLQGHFGPVAPVRAAAVGEVILDLENRPAETIEDRLTFVCGGDAIDFDL